MATLRLRRIRVRASKMPQTYYQASRAWKAVRAAARARGDRAPNGFAKTRDAATGSLVFRFVYPGEARP